jgi:hypothetical protein
MVKSYFFETGSCYGSPGSSLLLSPILVLTCMLVLSHSLSVPLALWLFTLAFTLIVPWPLLAFLYFFPISFFHSCSQSPSLPFTLFPVICEIIPGFVVSAITCTEESLYIYNIGLFWFANIRNQLWLIAKKKGKFSGRQQRHLKESRVEPLLSERL